MTLDRSEPPPEEPTAAAAEQEEEKPADVVYRTKAVEFLGRSTPIILQNDNGPCPLLAICNVLLLRNNLDLSPDESQVTQERLLSLVAGRLIDSNSNVQDKDDGYVSNQRQNISDAIDLLPRLATGIDVNVHFRKINDFEFTRECAIFDLLDIGLYHGWIVDPQDIDTAHVIGSKSYNTLVAELVAFETGAANEVDERIPDEDCIDFAAATTATLGVPSPSLSRGRSFEDPPPVSDLVDHGRKGDREETEQLMRTLDLSRNETYSTVSVTMSHDDWNTSSLNSGEGTHMMSSVSEPHGDSIAQSGDESETSHQLNMMVPTDRNLPGDYGVEDIDIGDHLSGSDHITGGDNSDQPVSRGSGDLLASFDSTKNIGIDMLMQDQSPTVSSTEPDESENFAYKDQSNILGRGQSESYSSAEDFTSHVHGKLNDDPRSRDLEVLSSSVAPHADPRISSGTIEPLDVSGQVIANLADGEPIYEGEECVLHSGLPTYEDREPVYEGEVVLAEQAGRVDEGAAASHLEDKVYRQEWKSIKNFLENNASQLTIYGLFALQEGLKERELCVFFRNNHFSTMFKFNGELYLLVTDQGYVNQPDLVWEKLNEVNGDTVFMTGNFKEFKADSQVTSSWNEQQAMNSTAEYIAGLDSSSPSTSTYNSDLQLAIELQKQEYELQPQRPQQQSSQQQTVSSRPRLVTGPQVPRSSAASERNASKTKDKCNIM